MLLIGFLFRQIFIVVLFKSKDLSATVFTVGEKAITYQTYNKTTESKEVIQSISRFSLFSDSCVWVLLWSVSQSRF